MSFLLSLDPSSRATGVALWDISATAGLRDEERLRDWTVLRPPSAGDYEFADKRLSWQRQQLDRWLGDRADALEDAVCEKVPTNARFPAAEAQVAVRMFTIWSRKRGLPCALYLPQTWRSSVGGGDKRGTADLLRHLLVWPDAQPRPAVVAGNLDIFDAIGIGLYRLTLRRFGGAGVRPAPGNSKIWLNRGRA